MTRTERRKQEVREKILAAAFDLFLAQGVNATKIEEICERADVANRTFFNHFATRQDMMRALAERRLVNLHDVFFDRGDEAIPVRLIGVFDDIAIALVKSGDTYREMIGEMLATNVCIGGQQSDELFVTAAQSQSLLRIRFDDNDPEGARLRT
jgi:AcrR family transcriptional regulator